jgi:hypothetical protein
MNTARGTANASPSMLVNAVRHASTSKGGGSYPPLYPAIFDIYIYMENSGLPWCMAMHTNPTIRSSIGSTKRAHGVSPLHMHGLLLRYIQITSIHLIHDCNIIFY